MRSQFTHVIDVAPTILEAAGLPEPAMVNGVQQAPIEGTSMVYAFNQADAPERHDLQYFEMFGNRGIYHRGWSAVTKHRTPWEMVGGDMLAFDDDVWELYDGAGGDFSQARDLAAEQPERLAQLQRLWLIEAVKYGVLPLDDRGAERLNSELAGRPSLIKGTSQIFFAGMGRLTENSVVNVKNKSFSITADIDVPEEGAEGVIIAQGGRFGGWAAVREERSPEVRVQPPGHPGVRQHRHGSDPFRPAPGPDGVRLRRWRPRQGRRRTAVPRRGARGRRPRRGDPGR